MTWPEVISGHVTSGSTPFPNEWIPNFLNIFSYAEKKEKRKRERGREVLTKYRKTPEKTVGTPTSGWGCANPRETPSYVTTGEKAHLGRILPNFRLCMHTLLPPPLRVIFGHYGVTLHNFTSGQMAPLGRILCNFRLRMRTPKETPNGHVNFGHFW